MAVGIFAVGTTELDHELIDHTMEMQPLVKTGLGQVNKVLSGNRHLRQKNLSFKTAKGRIKNDRWIGHWYLSLGNDLRAGRSRVLGNHFIISGIAC